MAWLATNSAGKVTIILAKSEMGREYDCIASGIASGIASDSGGRT